MGPCRCAATDRTITSNQPLIKMESAKPDAIFIAGGTGYIGKRLVETLIRKGYTVIVMTRKESLPKVPAGATAVIADPFDAQSIQKILPAGAVFIQLLGVPHPSPRKAALFEKIDLKSVSASAEAAAAVGVSHFIYVSVSMTPSSFMAAYQAVRAKGEALIQHKKLNATILRPWYVIGPGHYWPLLLLPLYGIAELIPSWRRKTRAMAFVTIRQMVTALANAVSSTPDGIRILEIQDIRKAGRKN